jgi:MATE family multidrug resistance protein
VLAQGIWFGLATTPLFLIGPWIAPGLLRAMGHSGQMLEYEIVYFGVLAFGAGATVLVAAQSAYFTGRGATRVVMLVDISATLLNAVLDYAWIFGEWGFPEWGVHGAAWATVVAQWTKVAVFAWLTQRPAERRTYQTRPLGRLDRQLLRRLLRFGGPSAFQMLSEGLAFTLLILFVGQLGSQATAATTLAFSINNVAFVPMMGLGIAVSTLVGQKLGENRSDLAERATWSALFLALAYTSMFAVLYVGFPEWFFVMHERFADKEELDAIRPTALILLRFVAAYCLFDAAQLVFAGAIKGAGDTRYVLIMTLSIGAIAIGIGKVFQAQVADPLLWWWWICAFWVLALAAAFGWRFIGGRWKRYRVIETQVVAEPLTLPTPLSCSTPNEPFVADASQNL